MNLQRLIQRFTSISCLLLAAQAGAAIVVTFDGVTVEHNPNGYIGGWYGNEVEFETWVGDTQKAQVADSNGNAVLRIDNDAIYRSSAFTVAPTELGAAGTYRLTFDVVNFSGSASDLGAVSIWSGSGYDLTNTSGNALVINTYTQSVDTAGTAISAQLGDDFIFGTTLTNHSIDYEYDGVSAISFFFGAFNGNTFPHVQIDYDNIRISTSPVPESSAYALIVGLVTLGCIQLKRRRKQK